MDWRRHVRSHLPPLDVSAERESEIVDELALQLEATYERARAQGASETDAVARALAEVPDWQALAATLSSLEVKAPARGAATARGGWSAALFDLRSATRSTWSWRGAAPAIALLGLSIAATLIVVSAAESWLLRSPFGAVERLALVWGTNRTNGQLRDVVSGPTFLDLQERTSAFTQLAAFAQGELSIRRDGQPALLGTLAVTPGFFDVVDTRPAAGRSFVADDVNTPVVMISFDLWQSQFGGDAGIVGRRLTRFGQPHEIIGVLPRGFRLLSEPDAVTLLDPRQLRAEARTFYYYWVIGRLRDDVSFADARRDLDGVMSDVAAQHVQVQGWSASIDLLGDALAEPVRPSLLVVAAIAALVLIVGIGNAANLVASHALARRRDMAIRLALGASPGRVRRQWFFEGCLIALGGTGLGVLVLAASLAPLAAYLPQSASIRGSAATVELAPLAAGPITLAVAFLLCACVGLLLGALPIRQPGLVDIGTATPRAPVMLTRERRWLLAAQSAVATLLTAVTGLLLVMVIQLRHTSPGFDASEVTALGIGGIHELDVAARARYYTQVIDAVSRVPGVMAVGLNDYVPLTNEDDYEGFEIPGRPRVGASWPREEWRRVSAGYFTAMRIPILSGRALTPADDERAASVVVINETMARKYWPGVDPVGTRIRITNARHGWSEIVGVAGDVREVALDAPAKPMMFVSYHRDPRPVMALFVKTMGRPDLAAAAVRAAIWSADPTRPLFGEATLSQIVGDSYVVQRSLLNVAAALASLALLLIAGGTYAVVALVTLGRVRELAVRIALGAGPLDVVSAVVARPCAWVGAGIAAGLAGAAIAAPVIGSQLASVPSFDARIALVTGTIVALIIAAACVAPLARALRTDAATTLRSE